VVSDPAGIDCGNTCSASFDTADDLPIGLFAVPQSGSFFAGWVGSSDCLDGTLSVAQDASCTAVFTVIPPPTGDPVTVSVTLAGDGGGSVASAPAGIDCGVECISSFAFGTRVVLNAVPDSQSSFAGFSGDGDCLDGSLDGTLDQDCIARFDALPAIQHTLTILFAGDGNGDVTSEGGDIACSADCSALFGDGETVILNARPLTGSIFGGYSGDCGSVSGFESTLVMGADATCTATFNSNQ
jgi:hypothetical protein